MNSPAKNLFAYRPHWAQRFGTAPFLPMSRDEMDHLGWDSCDIILVTGDAYIDHPSFGMAVIGRALEAQGFRVGIIAQPDWNDAEAFSRLGVPNLFFGVTAGNMDSLVNHYTSDRKLRSDDAYTPEGVAGKRPDRAVIVYTQKLRAAFSGIPIVIGGIEASLRRIAHYDYWSDEVRRSVLIDSGADILLYGNAERAVVELAHRIAGREPVGQITDIRGTVYVRSQLPPGTTLLDSTELDQPGRIDVIPDPYAEQTTCDKSSDEGSVTIKTDFSPARERSEQKRHAVIRLPSFQQVSSSRPLYAHASRVFHLETNPGNARALVQQHDQRWIWINPPPLPLETDELDRVFELPYARQPHPAYQGQRIPAWEMIRHSVNIMRGCFGGCTFCSITEHEGRIIQSRSEDSIIREIEQIRDRDPNFTGHISDVGGPTANMYRMQCKDRKIEESCRRLSCVYPTICKNLGTDHQPLIDLYRRARKLEGVKRVHVASGLRYDLAVRSPEYIKELVQHHVGGYLKIAPEHTEDGPLTKMMKPGIDSYHEFKRLFDRYSKEAGKEQYLIPYFISAHPGTSDSDMLNLALWLKQHDFRPDQVQAFLPTPMALASAMYYSGRNPLKKVSHRSDKVRVIKSVAQRRLHKAFLRYHDPANWPLLREALTNMGRQDLIGHGKRYLVPPAQPGASRGKKPARVSAETLHNKKQHGRRAAFAPGSRRKHRGQPR